MSDEQPLAPSLTEKQLKAIDLLYEAMLFWREEGSKLIKQLIYKLNVEGEGRVAAQIARTWKDVDDRWIDIASKLAPYQSAKHANVVINKTETKRFVIEAPRVMEDKRAWAELVAREQALLPKHDVLHTINNADDTIDDAEFMDVNAE
jgi:hypothetical protein